MKDTTSVEMVTKMESYKSQCFIKNAIFVRQTDEAYRKIMFLSEKHPVLDRTLNSCYEVRRWPRKLMEFLQYMDDKHKQQRADLESEVRAQ